uniref:Uncharacterized protein n=1 Tax=Derbesia sp. WEST4838 TaxID=1847751 RepID=A0A1C9JBF9_9CHLO|nr:hypothetical protein [Derbesia sp. WEST4838]AOP19185.1 hypothetical protein [Derbesia sp. WEST4838]
MKKQLGLSKFQQNPYLQLFIIFRNRKALNKYLNIFFQYHYLCRFKDCYGSQREPLFHGNWIGINNNLVDHLDELYNQCILNLKAANEINEVEQTITEWNQIAHYECEIFLYELNQMYQKNRDLEDCGFTIEKLIYTLYSNFDNNSYLHLSTLNKYMLHPIYGQTICYYLRQINLNLWKVACLGKFDDVVMEFIFILKTQFIYLLKNQTNQTSKALECLRIYLNILNYNSLIIQRLLSFLKYLKELPDDIWHQDFIIKSRKWVPVLDTIHYYMTSIDESFNDLFLNGNEDYYFTYPAQILNLQVHPFKLMKIQYSWLLFDLVCKYKNQITLLRVINTYLTFSFYCITYIIKQIIRLPWGKIIIYYTIIYICIKFFKV